MDNNLMVLEPEKNGTSASPTSPPEGSGFAQGNSAEAPAGPEIAENREAALESMRFLLLGGTASSVPGVSAETDAGGQYAAILLTKHTEPDELLDTLSQTPDPAVPIADFVGGNALRSDFVGTRLDADSVAEMKKQFAPIWRRLQQLPFKAKREERDPLTVLRLIYSRNMPAKAEFNPNSPAVVQYPLVSTALGTRRELESLAGMGLLDRRHFTRTHACSKCGSERLNVYEACPACGSADLTEETLIHHYRCGCQEPESHFARGLLLVCPKCGHELRHFGVDYGKPGTIAVCRACRAQNSMPMLNFICFDCSTVTPADRALTTDWYHYDLTERGIEALRQGRLSRVEMDLQAAVGPHAYSPAEFELLAMQDIQVARQHNRPFSIARISIPNLDAVRREVGTIATDASFHAAVASIIGAVRRGDFVGFGRNNSIYVGLPETTAAECGAIERQIRQAVRDVIGPFELAFDFAGADDAPRLFAERQ